jgi:hypothetical protein
VANNKVSLLASTDLGDYDVSMKLLRNTHFPRAVALTLNKTADSVTKNQISNVKKDMIVRVPYTINSMTSPRAKPFKALNKAKGTEIKTMFSRAGSMSSYLWMQDEDYTSKPNRDGRMPIPTLNARDGSIKNVITGTFRLKKNQRLKPGPISFNSGLAGFIGEPKGTSTRGKRRPYGIYARLEGGLRMIRNLESTEAKIKGTGFHSKAVKKFGQLSGGKANMLFKSIIDAELSTNPIYRKNILGHE